MSKYCKQCEHYARERDDLAAEVSELRHELERRMKLCANGAGVDCFSSCRNDDCRSLIILARSQNAHVSKMERRLKAEGMRMAADLCKEKDAQIAVLTEAIEIIKEYLDCAEIHIGSENKHDIEHCAHFVKQASAWAQKAQEK